MAQAQGENNSNWGGLFHYPDKGGNPKFCTLFVKMDLSGNIIETSEDIIEAGVGFTVSKVGGLKENCPRSGNGCTVYSCRVTNN